MHDINTLNNSNTILLDILNIKIKCLKYRHLAVESNKIKYR